MTNFFRRVARVQKRDADCPIKRAAGRAVDRRKVMRLDPSMLNDGAIRESTAEGSRSADCFANETTAIDGLKIAALGSAESQFGAETHISPTGSISCRPPKNLLLWSCQSKVFRITEVIQSFEAGLAFGYIAVTVRA
jgi:hypothetical protein